MSRAGKILENADTEHQKTLDKTGFWGKQGAGCLVYAESTKRFLVALRSRNVEQPGTYGTIGGAIDDRENPQTAAIRELKEETGFSGSIVRVERLAMFQKDTRAGTTFKYHNFLVVIKDEYKPRTNWETARFEWVNFSGLKRLSPKHFGLEFLLSRSATTLSRMSESRASTILDERLSSILYHTTSVQGLKEILRLNKFRCTSAIGRDAEHEPKAGYRFFFASFARSKMSRYLRTGNVIIVLDGDKLNYRYRGVAYDYWNDGTGTGGDYNARAKDNSEMEDRLLSYEQWIPNFSDYIKEIHINYRSYDKSRLPTYKEIAVYATAKRIPIYFYSLDNGFTLLDKRKAISLKELEDTLVRPTPYKYQSLSRDDHRVQAYIDLALKKPGSKLTDVEQNIVRDLRYGPMYLTQDVRGGGDNYRSFENLVSATRTSGVMTYLAKTMRQLKCKTLFELWLLINKNWNSDNYNAAVSAFKKEQLVNRFANDAEGNSLVVGDVVVVKDIVGHAFRDKEGKIQEIGNFGKLLVSFSGRISSISANDVIKKSNMPSWKRHASAL